MHPPHRVGPDRHRNGQLEENVAPHVRHGRHRRIAAALPRPPALALGLLSGCAAGQISQTADQVAAIDGANATVGDIGVRNALLQTPDGHENGSRRLRRHRCFSG